MSIPLAGSGNKVRKGLRFVASPSRFFLSRLLVLKQGSERDLNMPLPFNFFGGRVFRGQQSVRKGKHQHRTIDVFALDV